MNDLSEVVEHLAQDVEALKLRVSALENPGRALPASISVPVSTALTAAEPVSAIRDSGTFSVLGKAMLGIAGAYLLRALAESTALPRLPVIAVAVIYAFLWLVPAVRVPARAWFASLAWACTSALILVPMLWELTLRFHTLPSAVSAASLATFVIVASALAWNRHFALVSWVADAAGAAAALVLGIATHDLVPFIAALLLMSAAGEFAAARDRTLSVRPLIAMAADLAIFALIWIYANTSGSPEGYPAVGTALLLAFGPALLLIYAASASFQTIILRRRISFFETAQVFVAALLSLWSVLALAPGHGRFVLGVLCLLASAAGYAVTFSWFSRVHLDRDYHVYGTGSLALLLAGCFLCLPPGWLPLCLGIAAVASILVGASRPGLTLQFHGLALLAASALASGLLSYIARAMAGAFPGAPGLIVAATGACTLICYATVARSRESTPPVLFLQLLFAALAVGFTTALLVWTLAWLTAAAIAPQAEHFAVIRTMVACAAALALAWGGSRWLRRELVWLAWVALGWIVLKLLLEDLRHGHLGFTAASIFLYAVTLLLVPRLLRSKGDAANS